MNLDRESVGESGNENNKINKVNSTHFVYL